LGENTERQEAGNEDVLSAELVIDVSEETYGAFVIFGEVIDTNFLAVVGSRDNVIRCFEVMRERPYFG
jgi:hypothetical protein